jgi:hypothetical protein
MLESKTSFSKAEIEHLEVLCHEDLLELQKHQRQEKSKKSKKKDRLSSLNMLVMTLYWLWSYPKGGYRALAAEFNISKSLVPRTINAVLKILDVRTEFPRQHF